MGHPQSYPLPGRVHAGKQARNVARRRGPQNGTGDEKVPNLPGSERKGADVQQNQARIKAAIIQQPKFNNGIVLTHSTAPFDKPGVIKKTIVLVADLIFI